MCCTIARSSIDARCPDESRDGCGQRWLQATRDVHVRIKLATAFSGFPYYGRLRAAELISQHTALQITLFTGAAGRAYRLLIATSQKHGFPYYCT